MKSSNPGEQPPQARRTFGQFCKQAGLFILFGTILLIPRLRRLRRRVWAWTGVRIAVGACGGWLVWRCAHGRAGGTTLAGGLLLFAFSLLVRAKPAVKSLDALAHELGALVVLNGGAFRQSLDSTPIQQSKILVHPKQIIVLGPREILMLEIPLAKVRRLAVYQVTKGAGKEAEPWHVEINWQADEPCITTFQYEGVFAEHLARVTESTLRSQWKKELPVISE